MGATGVKTFRDQEKGAGPKPEELEDLNIETEGLESRESGSTCDGEIGAVGEVRPNWLQVRAQVARTQAFTCVPETKTVHMLITDRAMWML